MDADATRCIHCGFCLPACPTYRVLGNEADSPRGRLVLMDALESGRIVPSGPVLAHLDQCLLCRACESACPSGVAFGAHLQRTRAVHRTSTARPRAERLWEGLALRAVALPRWWQDLGAALARTLSRSSWLKSLARRPDRLGAAARLMRSGDWTAVRLPSLTPAAAGRAEAEQHAPRVGLLEGCVGRALFGRVNRASLRLLALAGCEVHVPAGQGCCGALHAHAGDLRGARALARANIAAFERAGALDRVAVNAAGCGAALAEYGDWLADDPAWAERARAFSARVADVLEILDERGLPEPPAASGAAPCRVAYHDACHLAHARGVRAAPRRLLAGLPGVTLLPLADADRCCGSAGLYNLLHAHTADALLAEKLARLTASGAEVAAAANPGCLLQLAAGIARQGGPLAARHPLEILDRAHHPADPA